MEVKYGIIASELELSGINTIKPSKHVVLWIGDHPCNSKGSRLTDLVNGPAQQPIRDGLVSSFSFSQKPPNGYANYYEKMTRYIQILQNEACVLDSTVTALVGRDITPTKEESVFCYTDTASSRAGITPVNERLKKDRVAIIGLGGTGSYVLDLVAKTHVEEIHLFDDDKFLSHNAFRAPGAPSSDDLSRCMAKVDWFAKTYSKMRKKIFPHLSRVNESNMSELDIMTVVFLCVDSGKSREAIINYLLDRKIPLIDVGMGLDDANGALSGLVRITTCTTSSYNHVTPRIPCNDATDDEYSSNIQIADMNALGAAFAVIKWKKMRNFYQDLRYEYNTVYGISTNTVTNDELPNETKDN